MLFQSRLARREITVSDSTSKLTGSADFKKKTSSAPTRKPMPVGAEEKPRARATKPSPTRSKNIMNADKKSLATI